MTDTQEFGRVVRTFMGANPTLAEVQDVMDSYEKDKARQFPTFDGDVEIVVNRAGIGMGTIGWYAVVPTRLVQSTMGFVSLADRLRKAIREERTRFIDFDPETWELCLALEDNRALMRDADPYWLRWATVSCRPDTFMGVKIKVDPSLKVGDVRLRREIVL